MDTILHNIIHYATKAPSDHNTQPWKFRVDNHSIYIYPDYTRLKHADADYHSLFISLGCALENLVVAANHFNLKETIHYNLDLPEEHIRVDLAPYVPAEKDNTLFMQLDKRQVNRAEYDGNPVPTDQLLDLVISCKEPSVFLKLFTDDKSKDNLFPFIEEAIKWQSKTKYYRQMLSEWVRFNNKEASIKKDGINGENLGVPEAPSWIGKLILNSILDPQAQIDKVNKLVKSSPVMMMFIALKQDKTSWVKLGRCYENIALKATAMGISHAHINMPCEVPEVREKLKNEFGFSVEEPLLMLRMGYAQPLPKSLRRELEDVMVKSDA